MDNIDDLELPPKPAQNIGRRVSEEGNSASSGPRQIKKRNRIPVSCSECRRRKLR